MKLIGCHFFVSLDYSMEFLKKNHTLTQGWILPYRSDKCTGLTGLEESSARRTIDIESTFHCHLYRPTGSICTLRSIKAGSGYISTVVLLATMIQSPSVRTSNIFSGYREDRISDSKQKNAGGDSITWTLPSGSTNCTRTCGLSK